jgi:ribosomal protein L7/L12
MDIRKFKVCGLLRNGPIEVHFGLQEEAEAFVAALGKSPDYKDAVVIKVFVPGRGYKPLNESKGQGYLDAIKKRRADTGEGLAEAKAWVDNLPEYRS